ncbi:MAG: hypothetical protein EPN26_05655 [Rhodospirillales bacterium]|nr:MAG: hypothetical protein EPN26_05655 [Rhodospirillales bacterium]
MRGLVLLIAGFLLVAGPVQASGKKLGEGPPMIDFNPMNLFVQGLERVETRLYTLHVEIVDWSSLPLACKSVPKIVDTTINDFRSNPPQVTKRNKLDMVAIDMRVKGLVLRHMDPKLVKRAWLEEGGSAGTGGVADRLPNACR